MDHVPRSLLRPLCVQTLLYSSTLPAAAHSPAAWLSSTHISSGTSKVSIGLLPSRVSHLPPQGANWDHGDRWVPADHSLTLLPSLCCG